MLLSNSSATVQTVPDGTYPTEKTGDSLGGGDCHGAFVYSPGGGSCKNRLDG
jgi:hypothetical protein